MRQREEIQKMSWPKLLILAPLAVQGAIWPPAFQEFTRLGEAVPFQPGADEALWREYGFIEGERAEYTDGKRRFQVIAWRMKDATGAMAAWYWQLPENARPVKGLPYSARYESGARRGALVALGNYLVHFEGYRPEAEETRLIVGDLPESALGPNSTLPSYLPASVRFASGRYVLGPESLRAFAAHWSPQQFGLEIGAEAILATLANGLRIAIIRYPTPHWARVKQAEFAKLGAGPVHRSGPLVAVGWSDTGAGAQSAALKTAVHAVEFRATVIEGEPNPYHFVQDTRDLLLSIFALTGGLLLACILGGVAAGGYRIFLRKDRMATGSFQSLGLKD